MNKELQPVLSLLKQLLFQIKVMDLMVHQVYTTRNKLKVGKKQFLLFMPKEEKYSFKCGIWADKDILHFMQTKIWQHLQQSVFLKEKLQTNRVNKLIVKSQEHQKLKKQNRFPQTLKNLLYQQKKPDLMVQRYIVLMVIYQINFYNRVLIKELTSMEAVLKID